MLLQPIISPYTVIVFYVSKHSRGTGFKCWSDKLIYSGNYHGRKTVIYLIVNSQSRNRNSIRSVHIIYSESFLYNDGVISIWIIPNILNVWICAVDRTSRSA